MAGMQGVRTPTLNKMNTTEPYVDILEQPQSRKIRFRYECEGRSAGSIPGENSTQERRTYPTIKLHNYEGPAIVVVSTVTRDAAYMPHPHSVVGKDCNRGVCTVKLKNASVISFPNLGIQCCKKKEVVKALKNRQQIRVDPFGTGFAHIQNPNNIDLGVVRLCFQVFLPDASGKFTKIVTPVISQPIFDRKTTNELVICRIDRHSGRAKGGEDVFLLCEKVVKDDIEIRFYEETVDGILIWEGFGEFGQGDVHRQFAIVFKTPPFRDPHITQPQQIMIQLRRPSDNETSESKPFQYMPEDEDPDGISMKRKRKAISTTESFLSDIMKYPSRKSVKTEPGTISGLTSDDIRDLLKRNIKKKEEAATVKMPDLSAFQGASLNLPTITQPPTAVPMSMVQQLDLSQLGVNSTMGTETNPGIYAQLLNSTQPNVYTPQQAEAGIATNSAQGLDTTGSMVINYTDGNNAMTPELVNQVLQEVDQLQSTAMMMGNYSFNFSFTESERGLTGDLLQTEHDPGIAAHENVTSGEEQIVSDPELNAQLLQVKKHLHSLNPQKI